MSRCLAASSSSFNVPKDVAVSCAGDDTTAFCDGAYSAVAVHGSSLSPALSSLRRASSAQKPGSTALCHGSNRRTVGAIGRHRRVGAGRDVFNSVRMVQTRPREKFLLRVPLNGCVSTDTRRVTRRGASPADRDLERRSALAGTSRRTWAARRRACTTHSEVSARRNPPRHSPRATPPFFFESASRKRARPLPTLT